MAALLSPLLDAEAADGFAPDLAAFLAPLEIEGPAGPSLRYDPVYARIREARTEEDASLPMGEWTRPLKKADWRAAEMLCTELLQRRSKDLQVAAWLTEAWVHRHGIDGLTAGARLLDGLVREFWEGVHPRMDDGDSEIRAAAFIWTNDTLAQTLLLHVPLVPWPDFTPPFINLCEWQRAITSEFGTASARAKAAKQDSGTAVPVASRQDILDQAGYDVYALAFLDDRLALAWEAWDGLAALLDERLGASAPSLSKVTDMLAQLRQAVRSLLQGRDPRDEEEEKEEPEPAAAAQAPYADWAANACALPATSMDDHLMSEAPSPSSFAPLPAGSPLPQAVASGQIGSRAEAYRLLELAAAYLLREEPHSPTPYLVNRAVAWGRMPLPQLMQEVLREDGDLNRFFSIIGVRPDV